MLRSQRSQPVCASWKKMSRSASSVGGLRGSHVAPPSEVESSAPLLPAAHPLRSSTKKTECSHANVPVRCRSHAAARAAEGDRQKAEGRRQRTTASLRVLSAADFNFLPSAFCPSPLMSEPSGEDAREAE